MDLNNGELIDSVDDEENTFGTEWLLKLTAATGALILLRLP